MPELCTKSVVVQEGGRIELILPEVEPGEWVRVTISREHNDPSSPNRRAPGSARGQVWMGDDFDETLDEFREYM